jgi:O-antigen ligase
MAQHPLELASTMSVLLPLAVTCVVQSSRQGSMRVVFVIATGVIGAAALLSVSRTAMIATGLSLLVVLAYWPWRRIRVALWSFAGVAVIATLTLGSLVSALVFSVLGASNDPSVASRGIGQAYVLSTVGQHPLFGQGLGTYQVGTQPILDNQYLSYLAETGIIGLCAVALPVVYAMVLMLRLRRHPSVQTRDLAGGLLGSLVGLALFRGVQDTDAFVQITYLGALVFGAAAALHQVRQPVPDDALAFAPSPTVALPVARARV